MERQYHHQVIEAAFLHTKIDCYFVGTYAQRVSFASQQYRALDLVAGLHEIGKLKAATPNLKVAVVGGGLAGLMAAAAVRSTGASVHVFEAADDILQKQGAAAHRIIHPTISLWPQEKPQLSTNLPVFDWCAGNCKTIIQNMKAEWQSSFNPYLTAEESPDDQPLKLTVNAQITDYTKNSVANEGRLRCDSEFEWLSDLSFDLVIVATGYGVENSEVRDSISYWRPDELLEKRKEVLEGKHSKLKFFVSGCGDGGLIEALRLVHGDFLNGWLTIVAAEALHETGIADEIWKAEQRALMWSRSILARDPEKVAAAYTDSEVAAHLQRVYTSLADRLRCPPPEDPDRAIYLQVHKFLTTSLNKIKLNGRVFLVSPLDGPFAPNAAPIHKLLVAHALKANRLEYRKGTYRTGDKGSWIDSAYEPVDSDDDHILIPRHGPETSRTNIIDSREQQSLRLRQIMLADRLEVNKPRKLIGKENEDKKTGVRLPHVAAMIAEIDDRFVVDATPTQYLLRQVVESELPNPMCAASIGDGVYALKKEYTLFGSISAIQSEEPLDIYPIS